MKIKAFMIALVACAVASCGGNTDKAQQSETPDQEQSTVVEEVATPVTNASYDLDGIKKLTGKSQLTEAEQDFVLDQYEIYARATKGLDKAAKKEYLKNLGADGKIVMLVVIGAENSKRLTDAQKARLKETQEKYK